MLCGGKEVDRDAVDGDDELGDDHVHQQVVQRSTDLIARDRFSKSDITICQSLKKKKKKRKGCDHVEELQLPSLPCTTALYMYCTNIAFPFGETRKARRHDSTQLKKNTLIIHILWFHNSHNNESGGIADRFYCKVTPDFKACSVPNFSLIHVGLGEN